MSREHEQYLDDIIEAVGKIEKYTEGMNYEDFRIDGKTIDAVVRNLEIIGEAARKLPDHIKAGAPGVEWRKIVALRNIIAHEYFGINTEIIWDVIKHKTGLLKSAVKRILNM